MCKLMMQLLFGICLVFSVFCYADWAEELLAKMNLDQKIGQLFIASAFADQAWASVETMPDDYMEHVEELITRYHVGGFLFKRRWQLDHLKEVINHYQSLSQIPLLTAMDLEWGPEMRIDQTMAFPRHLTLGAIQDDSLIYELGAEIGRQCQLLGININLAPVADINTNAANPVIHDRSFGEDKEAVARKSVLFMQGLKDQGIISCAKHFPGHGDTWMDSHEALPHVAHSYERLKDVEFYPFQQLIQAGITMVMTAHLWLSALEPLPKPASLSPLCTRGLLRDELQFKGIIITDDLMMKAVQGRKEPGETALEAFLAGNDLILSTKEVITGIRKIKQAVEERRVAEASIDESVLNILRWKEWLSKQRRIPNGSLNSEEAFALKQKLYEEAITLVKGSCRLSQEAGQIGYLQIGGQDQQFFYKDIQREHALNPFFLSHADILHRESEILQWAEKQSHLLIAIFDIDKKRVSDVFGLKDAVALVSKLNETGKPLYLVLFGTPYSVPYFADVDHILLAYEEEAQRAAAKVLLQKLPARGRLPIRIKLGK
jgi:beta-N-acetylhexosaminidase